MLQLSDKELDQLSQKAAEQYDPGLEHSPGSWSKLEQQLARDMGRSGPSLFRGYRRIPFLYAPIVVLLVGVTYFMTKQGSRQNSLGSKRSDTGSLRGRPNGSPPGSITRVIPSAASPQASDAPALKKDLSPKNKIPEKNSTTEKNLNASSSAEPATGNNRIRALDDGSSSAAPVARSGSGSQEGAVAGVGTSAVDGKSGGSGKPRRFISSDPFNKSDAIGKLDVSGSHDASGQSDATGNSNAAGKPGGDPILFYSTIAGPVLSRRDRPVVYDSALRALGRKIAAGKKAAANAKSRSLHINNPLQIGLLYGPEFTTVKSVEGTKPGHNLGFTAGYKLFAGFSVNTGFLWNRTNYTAPAQDFHPPQGSWFANNNLVQLHFVQGSMNMIEIPLNIRYDLKVPDNTLFYFSAGLSSYLSGSENCMYFYENFGMNRRSPEKINDRENYWFSALNLAFGLEKPITSVFSFQAEPYLKLPLNGIGAGNVQLNSFGLNLSLKYTPVLGKSRR